MPRRVELTLLFGAALCGAACGDGTNGAGGAGPTGGSAASGATTAGGHGGSTSAGGSSTGGSAAAGATGGAATGGGGGSAAPLQALVVTFNTGTTEGLEHDAGPGDVYTSDDATTSNLYYGDGLAWLPAVEATRQFFATLQPDLVAFQEIFHPEDCASIPAPFHTGFYCEQWTADGPTVAQYVLGAGYQVACHLGKTDKCAAVRTAFGTFQGCSSDLCLDGLDGGQVQDCGSGSRIGRGVVDLAGGGTLTIVSVHGSSGILLADQQCRVQQIDQVFLDLGDGQGQPAANGIRNVVLGDFNTDPGRNTLFDLSAQRWNAFVGDGKIFHWVSPVGPAAPPTYAGLLNIDHVVSDAYEGSCWSAGVTPGHPDVYPPAYFDHKPLVCDIAVP